MRRIRYALFILLGLPLLSILGPSPVSAQTGAVVAYSVNPTIYQAGQSSSCFVCVSSMSISPLTLSPGDRFIFSFDSSVGAVLFAPNPVLVNSPNISGGDFATSQIANAMLITYNGANSVTFAYGTSLCLKINFTASAQVGSGKISFQSRFDRVVNGNLPYAVISIVDFPTSGLPSVAHDATLDGSGTNASPLRIGVPLILSGNVVGQSVVSVTNTGDGGGVEGTTGVSAQGGSSQIGSGGTGVTGFGGNSDSSSGGFGLHGLGGNSFNNGGIGVVAEGGIGRGAGNAGGIGIEAFRGVGLNGATDGRAAEFIGEVQVFGNFNATGVKNFKIDHPLDPENKYLYHAAIESSEVLNIYSGNILTGSNGEAIVTLPDWFEALNKDLRYQLTVIGTFAQAIVAEKVHKNRFTIRTNAPNVEVSWQVSGVRSDAMMLKHPFKPEQDKPEAERGTFLSPEEFGQPEERGVEWARHPELIQRMKQLREQAKQKQSGSSDR